MKTQTPFKRLILRAVLRKVSPMVIRVLAVPDCPDLSSFDEVFRLPVDVGAAEGRRVDGHARAAQVETVIAMLTAAHPDRPPSTWAILREVMDDGLRSIDQRLEEYGPLEPNRFSLKEANQRLAKRMERGRYRA